MQTYLSGARAIKRQGSRQTSAIVGYLDGLNVQIVPLEDEIRSTIHPSQMRDLAGGGRNFSGNPNVGYTLYTPNQAIENEKALDRDMNAFDAEFIKQTTASAQLFNTWQVLFAEWRAYFKKHGTVLSVLFATPGGVWTATEKYRARLNEMIAATSSPLGPSKTNGPSEKAAGDSPWWQPSTKTTVFLTLFGAALTIGGGYWAYRKYAHPHVSRIKGALGHYHASGSP